MQKKNFPEVFVILLAALLIAIVITVFNKKIEKLEGKVPSSLKSEPNIKKP